MSNRNQQLADLFQAHGIPARVEGDAVVFAEFPYRAHTEIFQHPKHGTIFNLQLDVRLQIAPNRLIVESSTGLADTLEDAANDGFKNFTVQSFHVLLAAFFLDRADEQINIEDWTVGARKAQATIGNFTMKGQSPLSSVQYQQLLSHYQKLVEAQTLSPGTHWIRFYCGHIDHKPIVYEALLDNQTWEPVQSQMARFPWPKQQNFYSVRLFLVLKVEKGGTVTPEIATRWLIELVTARENFTQDEICAELESLGVPVSLSNRVYNFTQIAAGHVIMRAMKVPHASEYCCFNENGEIADQGKHAEEPSYATAAAIVEQRMGTPGMKHLALTSADVNCVNNILNEGKPLEGIKVSHSFIFLGTPTDEGYEQATKTINSIVKAKPKEVDKAMKKSWKFWK